MYHRFWILSFADGHLGCFQNLAIVNCAAMNIGLRGFFWTGVKDCDCFSFGSKFSYPHYEHYRFSKGVISKLQIVQ